MNHKYLYLAFAFVVVLGLVGVVSGFQLEKHLVQTSVDENYPCHIEDTDTIVCPALSNAKIDEWKTHINSLKPEEKDLGKISDSAKIAKLNSKKTLYTGEVNKDIDLTKEYREKVNVYTLDTNIEIGFGTNTFGISGTPFENFDTNTTTGLIRYRPLNDTWISLGINGAFQDAANSCGTNSVCSFSIWVKVTGTNLAQRALIDAKNIQLSINNTHVKCGLTELESSFTNVWTQIGCTYNKTTTKLYVNGSLVDTEIGTIGNTGGTTYLFSGVGLTSLGTAGLPDEVRWESVTTLGSLYNETTMSDLYNSGRIPNASIGKYGCSGTTCAWMTSRQGSGSLFYNRYTGSSISVSNTPTHASDGVNITTVGYNVDINLTNITSALIFWDNGTLINQSFTGNTTFTFLNNQTIYVLENFKINQSNQVLYSPFNFTVSNASFRHISSTLNKTINMTTIINSSGVNCNQAKNFTYLSHNGVMTTWKTSALAKAVCTNLTTTGQILQIDPATASNELEMQFDTTAPVITVTSPTATTYETGEVLIDFNATDDVGIDSLWYSNGVTNITYAVANTITISTYDTLTYTFYANDTSNNVVSTSVTFTMKNPATVLSNLTKTFLKSLLGFVALIVLVFSIGGFYIYIKNNFNEISTLRFVEYSILLLLVVIASIILINHIINSL